MPLVRATSSSAAARARGHAAFLDAAEALVAGGVRFADVSVAALAAEAGFSRASFYLYFSDKRALAVAVAGRFQTDLQASVGGWLRGEDGGELRDALRRTLTTFSRHRGAVLLLAEASAYDEELAAVWRGLHAVFEQLVVARLRRDLTGIGKAEAEARAFTLVWSTQAVVVEHLRSGRVRPGTLTEALDRLWQAGLAR